MKETFEKELRERIVEINNEHENKRYLPGYKLSNNLTVSNDIVEVATGKEFLIIAAPSLYLSSTIKQIVNVPNIADGSTVVAALTKGFVPSNDGPKLVLETIEAALPEVYKGQTVYISGPSHAEEVAMGKLTGLIAASENPKNSIRVRDLLRVPGLMVYSSFDVVGVQICAAAKNVIAVVYGAFDAVAEHSQIFGDNSQSLLFAAGLNEIQALGMAMGATHPETFTSIAGVGDLDVTCKSEFGRNRRFGQDIIKTDILSNFKNIDDLIANIGESLTSILDKIKNMLAEFEYFYNLEGQFVFQRKKSFINTLWTPMLEGESEDIDEDGNSIYYSEKSI